MNLVVGLWQPRVVGKEQHLPAHLPGLKLKTSHFFDQFLQVHNRMTMEEYGRLMVNYKDTPAEQQQKQTRQMSYVESNIDWCVLIQCQKLKPAT